MDADLIADLISRARAGDRRAQEDLVRAYQQPMGRFVVSLIGPGDDYLDVCQVVFEKMIRALPRLKSETVFKPWLYRIARNASADHLRRRRSDRGVFVALDARHQGMTEARTPADALEAVRDAVEQLEPGQRALLDLSLERPRTYDELARLANLSVAAVRNRLFRARERLRKLVARETDDDG